MSQKMHWNFGGNFEPVIETCKFDWMKCSFALVYYVWYEVVTDVVDCLANETILWKVSAILSICTALAYLINWKIRCMKELTLNKENSKHLDLKISDLELKINILSYKAQYGIWPLLPFTNKNKNVKKIESSLSQLSDENLWRKYLSISGQRKQFNDKKFSFNIQSHLSKNDLNAADAKYKASNFGDESNKNLNLTNEKSSYNNLKREQNKDFCSNLLEKQQQQSKGNKNKLPITNLSEDSVKDNLKSCGDSSVDYHYAKNSCLGIKKNLQDSIDTETLQSKLDFSNDILTERKEIVDINLKEEKLELLQSTLYSNTIPTKFEDKYFNFSSTDTEMEKYTHETLDQIKMNLENIQLTLQNCCLKDFWGNVLISDKKQFKVKDNSKDDLYQTTETNNNNYDYLNNPWNQSNYETTICLQNSAHTDNVSSTSTSTYPYLTLIQNEQMPTELNGYKNNGKYSTFEYTEIKQNDKIKNEHHFEQANILTVKNNVNDYKEDLNKCSTANNIVTEKYSTEPDKYNRDIEYAFLNSKLLSNNKRANNISKLSLAEVSKESDSDDKSTTTLIEEALKIKKELLFQMEMKNDKSEINVQNTGIIKKNSEDKPDDILGWQNSDIHFQPKILDIITEESSESSVTSKIKTKTIKKHDKFLKIETDDNDNSDDKNNRNQFPSNKNINSINTHSMESLTSQNKTVLRQEKIRSVNNDSNKSCRFFNEKCSNEMLKCNENDNLISSDNKNLVKNNNEDCLNFTGNYVHNEINAISKDQKVNTYQNFEPSDLNLTLLTDSSSDISVDKMIDRLIENERKSKSVNSVSDIQSKKKPKLDSLNNFIDAYNFLESVQSENEESDNCFTEFHTTKPIYLKKEKIMDDSFQIHSENKAVNDIFVIKNPVNCNKQCLDATNNDLNDLKVSKTKNKEINYNQNLLENEEFDQDDSLKSNTASLNSKPPNPQTTIQKNYFYNEGKAHNEHLDNFLLKYNSKIHSNANPNKRNIKNFESENYNKQIEDISENKKYTDFFKSKNDTLSNNVKDSLNKVTNINPETESKETDKRDAGDFYNESCSKNVQLKEEMWDIKASDINNEIIKSNFPCGDTNATIIDSNNILINPKKSKNSIHHTSCKVPSNNYGSLIIRNSEQKCFKIDKNIGSNLIQRSVKNNSDAINNKQFKAKSNLNLTLIDKNNSLSTSRRSKSYIIPRDISFGNQYNVSEKRMCIESLTSSNKLHANICNSKEVANYDNKICDTKNENSYDLLKFNSNSFSQLHIPAPKEVLIDNNNFKSDSSSSLSSDVNTLMDFGIEDKDNIDPKNKNMLESFTTSAELSSKPYILASKNKLDVESTECDSCQTDSVKEPLTILLDRFGVEDKRANESTDDSINNVEKENNIPNEHNSLQLQYSDNFNQNSYVYVNFVTDDGKITTKVLSSEQFLEYIREGELKIKSFVNNADFEILNHSQLMALSKSQGTAVIPLVTNNDLNLNCINPSLLQTNNNVSNAWRFKAESKETEVLVKPSCLDISTSVSDLPNISDASRNKTPHTS